MTDVQVNPGKDDAAGRLQENEATQRTGKKATRVEPVNGPRQRIEQKTEATSPSLNGSWQARCREVKPSAPLPSGFQVRPQGPPGVPRYPANNGPVGGPRPGGQPPAQIRRLDSRSSLAQPGPGQFVQLRPYGPPRPPGGTFPQRPAQPGQNHPQNSAIVLNPRFIQPSGLRGPGPQQGPRPAYHPNYQPQQSPRSNAPRIAQGSLEHTQNGPWLNSPSHETSSQRAGQEIAQRALQRNESSLNVLRQRPASSEEEQKQQQQQTRPRIVIERMSEVERPMDGSQQLRMESSPLRKKPEVRENGENDDDDDVVMDGGSTPRANGSAGSERDDVVVGSRALNGAKRNEDVVHTVARPGTATIEEKSGAKSERAEKPEEKLGDATGKPTSAKADGGKVVEPANEANSVSVDDRPATAKDNEKKVEEPDGKAVMEKVRVMEDPSKVEKTEDVPKEAPLKVEKTEDAPKETPSKGDEVKNAASEKIEDNETVKEEEMKSPLTPNDVPPAESKSPTPSTAIAEDKTEKLDLPRPNTPAVNEQPQNEEVSKTPTKSPEKSSTSSPAHSVQDQKEVESKAPPKSPEVTPSNATAEDIQPAKVPEETKVETKSQEKPPLSTPPAKEQKEEPKVEVKESKAPSKSPDPAAPSETKDSNVEVAASKPSSPEKPSENPHRDKTPDDTPEPQSTVVTETSVKSPKPKEAVEKSQDGASSPENRENLALPDLVLSPPRSPRESVKGFDNGQRRSLSSRSSPCHSPQSQSSPNSSKSLTEVAQLANGEKKKTTFAEDSIGKGKDEEVADKTAAEATRKTPSKSPTPTGKARAGQRSEKKSPTKPEVENGNATNESSESNAVPTTNGVADSPTKKSPSKTKDADKRSTAGSPVKSPSKSAKSLPRTPETPSSTAGQEKKKLPMNKVQVGSAPSPNLKTVRSKIGSLENASYKPGGGKVKIENRKLDFSKAQPKIAAKNEKYTPSGGDKKIAQMKLQWNAKPKVGSLDNATYKPGGGDKKIETVKLDFKDKAKPKVGSKDNAKHTPGGGGVKSSTTPPKTPQDSSNDIQTQKVDIKAESKIGSLDNVKHKPGGGDKKIFNDRDYLRQTGSNVESLSGSGSQVATPGEDSPPEPVEQTTKDDSPQPPPSTPTKARSITSPTSSAVTPRAVRSSLARSPESTGPKRNSTPTLEGSVKEEANKKDLKVEATESKSATKEKPSRSPTSPRPPNTLRLKSPEKSSPGTPRKASPKELRLPKLAPSPVAQEAAPVSETAHSKITLPKLIEPSTHSTRVAH